MPGPADSNHFHRHHFTPLRDSNHHERYAQWLPDSSKIAYFGISVVLGYYILKNIDTLASSFFQSLWNIFVFLTPSRIILALDKGGDSGDGSGLEATSMLRRKARQTAKSDAMQRIFGLNTDSFLTTFPRARSFSGIGQAFLGLKESSPPGLGNWDNSCYQNSVIQGFASLRSLDRFLAGNMKELEGRDPFSTHTALKDIIDKLNSPLYSGRKLWTPPELKSMSSWQQQDAQEYFSKVIDQVDKEIRQASKGLTSDAGLRFVDPKRNDHKVGPFPAYEGRQVNDELKEPRYGEYTCTFRNPLEGLLAQRVGCMSCGWTEGLSLIPFNCLTVPLGSNWEYDVRECLDEYTTLEPIEGVECAKCTLLRTKGQLKQLLEQIDTDAELEGESSPPQLTEALRNSAETRLKVVQEALDEEDFSDKTLSNKCHIPPRNRVSSTKSRQAVIARAPKSLVIHVNRSVFNEMTGALRKNYADVRFPTTLDLGEWCLGEKLTEDSHEAAELWSIDPSKSMLPRSSGASVGASNQRYELRAVVTHYGRHENGHYICYRKYSMESFPAPVPQAVLDADGEKEKTEHWFRLSDEDVSLVSESNVLSQGGVFMLFYEYIDELPITTTRNNDEKQNLEEGIALEELRRKLHSDTSSSEAKSTDLDTSENQTGSSRSSTSCAADGTLSSPVSAASDTSASSASSDDSSPADKIQSTPAMKTPVTSSEGNQETYPHADDSGPSAVTAA
ncbi:hypothetical protein FQN52_002299 [Onygenales sp. PD_12]|nr:hypothetical protein FQN52_002299 [Onygenales sp. PD_12]